MSAPFPIKNHFTLVSDKEDNRCTYKFFCGSFIGSPCGKSVKVNGNYCADCILRKNVLKSFATKEVNGCLYKFSRGPKRGSLCGKPTEGNSDYCSICILRKNVSKSAVPNSDIPTPDATTEGNGRIYELYRGPIKRSLYEKPTKENGDYEKPTKEDYFGLTA